MVLLGFWLLAHGAPWIAAPEPVLYPGFVPVEEPAPVQLEVGVWKRQRRASPSASAALLGVSALEEELERLWGGELALRARVLGGANTGGELRWPLPGGGEAYVEVLELMPHRARVLVGLVQGAKRSEWTQEVSRGREVVVGGRDDLLLTLQARW
jgi:hypothetical protein